MECYLHEAVRGLLSPCCAAAYTVYTDTGELYCKRCFGTIEAPVEGEVLYCQLHTFASGLWYVHVLAVRLGTQYLMLRDGPSHSVSEPLVTSKLTRRYRTPWGVLRAARMAFT